jgi:cell division protein FtsB
LTRTDWNSLLVDMVGHDLNSEKHTRFATLRGFCGTASLSRRKIATGAAAVLALGVGYHVIFGPNGLTVFERKRQETHMLTTQLQDLRRENEVLKGHVDRLQNDPSAIEHQAREELHYTRPGEVIYALPAPAEGAAKIPEGSK